MPKVLRGNAKNCKGAQNFKQENVKFIARESKSIGNAKELQKKIPLQPFRASLSSNPFGFITYYVVNGGGNV